MSSFRLVALISAMVAVALSVPVYEEHQHIEEEHYEPAHYEFRYSVNDEYTHDIKEQYEKREGDKVEGYYSLIEPDGTKRTVHYTSDKGVGFNAHVEKSGEPVHAPAPAPAPARKLLLTPAIPVVKKVAVPVVKKVAYPTFHAASAAPVHTYSSSLHQYSAPASHENRYSAPAAQQYQYSAPVPQQHRYSAPSAQQHQYTAPASQEHRYLAPAVRQHQYSAPASQQYQSGDSTSYSTIRFGSDEQHYGGHQ